MKKVSFNLTVNWEGRPDGPEKLELKDEIYLPDHATDTALGFKTFEFGRILLGLYVLAWCKGIGYGNSWCKRGEIRGVAANIDRKYDRLSQSFEDMERHNHNDPAPRIDGAGDLLVYCALYLSSWVVEKFPLDFKKWWDGELNSFIDRWRKKNHDNSNDDDKKAAGDGAAAR